MTDRLCLHGTPHRYIPAEDEPPVLADVVAKVKANMQEKYTLVYTDYRDEFSPAQVEVLLSSENEWEHSEFERVQEWADDQRHDASDQVIRDILTNEEYAVLDRTDDYFDLLTDIQDGDVSTWFDDILRNTGSMLFRYNLDVPVSTDWASTENDLDAQADEILTVFGELTDEQRDKVRAAILRTLPEASYGGALTLLVYGDVQDWYRNTMHARNGKRVQVTFRDFNLLIHDGMNGSGMDVKIEDAPLTITLDPDELHTDVAGPGYSWTDIAGPVESAYAADVTFTVED